MSLIHEGSFAERGRSVPATETVRSPKAAVEAAESLGYPVVAKVTTPSVQHKSEWASYLAVNVNLEEPDAVREAAEQILGQPCARNRRRSAR